jgi:hypothetical protein
LKRIFAERPELKGGKLAVKMHPSGTGSEEEIFIRQLREALPVPVLPLMHGLNFEFMLPHLRTDYVMAGACGALRIVRRLKSGRAIALREMVDLYKNSDVPYNVDAFLQGIEIW